MKLIDLFEAHKIEVFIDRDKLEERMRAVGYTGNAGIIDVPDSGPAMLAIGAKHAKDDPVFHVLWKQPNGIRPMIEVLQTDRFQELGSDLFPDTEEGYEQAAKYFKGGVKSL